MGKKKRKRSLGRGRPTTVSVVDLANDRHPWDRQPRETDPAWVVFVVYRDLGPTRTVKQAVDKLGKNKRYNSTAQQMSARYGWRIRVEAYDRERDRVRREEAEKVERANARKTAEEMSTTAESLWKLAARGCALWHEYLTKHQGTSKPAILPRDLEALANTGIKLQRMLGGEVGEISEVRGTFADLVRSAREERDTEDTELKRAVG